MFDFLTRWDPILAEYKCDIDGVIKGDIKLWAVAMQTYCERLMKIFNSKEKIYAADEKITFGQCVNDPYFRDLFQEKIGFYDFESLKRLNSYSNNRKHQGALDDIEKREIKEWLKRLHTLSLKTFNYVNNESYFEEFNEYEVEKMLIPSEEEFMGVVEYADLIIGRKNADIERLENDYKDLDSLINDDTNEILRLQSLNNKFNEMNNRYKKISASYKSLIDLFGEYVELSNLFLLLRKQMNLCKTKLNIYQGLT